MTAEGGGDAGVAGQAQDGDGEVSQGGHDPWRAGGADLGAVFVVVQVADPVQAVFDQPVAADDGGEFGGAGLGGGQRRDREDGLTGPILLPGQLAAADELEGLGGVGEGQPGGHGGDLEGAALSPCPRWRLLWAMGTCRQGREASWANRPGWLRLTVIT